MSSTTSNKSLLILGGGAAGLLIAMKLASSKGFDITLVDSKTFYEYTPALCSVLYEASDQQFHKHFNDISFELEPFLNKIGCKFILGKVETLKDDKVYLYKQDEGINYDYLVICTGSSYADPWKTQNKKDSETITKESRIEFLTEQREKYKSAQKILCIGGGPVGVELVTEIAYRDPTKELTLVDSNPVVLHSAPDNMGDHAQRIINARSSIKSVLNEKCEEKQDGIYETDKSHTEIKADLVYNCIGVTPNTLYLEGSDWLNVKKQIKVDAQLRVLGQQHVFAIGDVNSVAEPKMFYTAHMQAIHFVKNLKRLLQGHKLLAYEQSRANMVVSMGPSYAVGHLSGVNLTGWPLGLKKGSKVASHAKYMIERVTMDDFGLKLPVNEILYYTSRSLFKKYSKSD